MSARVIRIFDRRRLAVNLGTNDGVQRKDKLLIYTPDSDIVDPESGESLGTYRRLKATVFVSEVFERFCIAMPPQKREQVALPSPPNVQLPGLFGPRTETRLVPGQLEVSDSQIEPLPTGGSVQVGDMVERELVVEAEQAPATGSSDG